jgi:pimeloyl-ACP methyl ester carboxylesterase
VIFHVLWRFAVPIKTRAPSVGCAASAHKQPNYILTGFGKLLIAFGMMLFALSGQAALRIPNFPVIFIHGVNDNAEDNWGGFQRFLSINGWIFGGIVRYNASEDHVRVRGRGILDDSILDTNQSPADFYSVQFSSNNQLTFEQQGQELDKIISAVLNVTKRNEVILVGHSMGGLAARAYLQSVPYKFNPNVVKLITVGTPHLGSRESDHCLSSGIGFVLSVVCTAKTASHVGPRSLSPDSEKLKGLNGYLKFGSLEIQLPLDLPDSVEYTSIIVSWGAKYTLTKCCFQLPPNAIPQYNEPGDGIVTIASQDLSSVAKNIKHKPLRVDFPDTTDALPIGCGHHQNKGYLEEVHTCETYWPEVWYHMLKTIFGATVDDKSFPILISHINISITNIFDNSTQSGRRNYDRIISYAVYHPNFSIEVGCQYVNPGDGKVLSQGPNPYPANHVGIFSCAVPIGTKNVTVTARVVP